MHSLHRHLIVFVWLTAFWWAVQAKGAILDWDQSYGTWTAGAPAIGSSVSQSYNNDSTHAGNDVTITLSNTGGTWGTGGTGSPGSPSVNTNYNGGTSPAQKTLDLNYSSEATNSPDLKVTINFSAYSSGVTQVNFKIFDVDYSAGTWIDQISKITAVTTTGAIVGPASVTGSTDNVVTGSGTNYVVTGVSGNAGGSSSLGNVNINFGTAIVTSVTFSWANLDAARGDQKIGLHDINYTAVATPEVHPALAAMLVCGGVVIFRKFRRHST